MKRASSGFGKPIAYPEDTESLLERAGFVDINHKKLQIDLKDNNLDRRMATMRDYFKALVCEASDDQGNLPPTFDALSLSLFTKQLGTSPRDVQALCGALCRVFFDRRLPLHYNM